MAPVLLTNLKGAAKESARSLLVKYDLVEFSPHSNHNALSGYKRGILIEKDDHSSVVWGQLNSFVIVKYDPINNTIIDSDNFLSEQVAHNFDRNLETVQERSELKFEAYQFQRACIDLISILPPITILIDSLINILDGNASQNHDAAIKAAGRLLKNRELSHHDSDRLSNSLLRIACSPNSTDSSRGWSMLVLAESKSVPNFVDDYSHVFQSGLKSPHNDFSRPTLYALVRAYPEKSAAFVADILECKSKNPGRIPKLVRELVEYWESRFIQVQQLDHLRHLNLIGFEETNSFRDAVLRSDYESCLGHLRVQNENSFAGLYTTAYISALAGKYEPALQYLYSALRYTIDKTRKAFWTKLTSYVTYQVIQDVQAAADVINQEYFTGNRHFAIWSALAYIFQQLNRPLEEEYCLRTSREHGNPCFTTGIRHAELLRRAFRRDNESQIVALNLLMTHGLNLRLAKLLCLNFCNLGEYSRAYNLGIALLQIERKSASIIVATATAALNLQRSREAGIILESGLKQLPSNPNLRWLKCLTKLSAHSFSEGWIEYGWRFRLSKKATKDIYYNIGQITSLPRKKSLLLATEQGLGEEILLASLLPEYLAAGNSLALACSRRLHRLFGRSFPSIKLLRRSEISANIENDYYDHIGLIANTLPILRSDVESFNKSSNYLIANQRLRDDLRAKYERIAGGRRIVGISWRSNSKIANKNIPFEYWEYLLRQTDCIFVNLQYGIYADELDAYAENSNAALFKDSINPENDIDSFAALISAMDSIITVSNTTLHLSGALGVSCHALLPAFLPTLSSLTMGDGISMWYPSVRLHRPGTPNNWLATMKTVIEALRSSN